MYTTSSDNYPNSILMICISQVYIYSERHEWGFPLFGPRSKDLIYLARTYAGEEKYLLIKIFTRVT